LHLPKKTPAPYSGKKGIATEPGRNLGQSHGTKHHIKGSGKIFMRNTRARKFKTTGMWMIMMFIFITELLFYTWCRVQNVQHGYEISREAHNQKKLIAYQNNLKIELARLKSPDRIAKIAKQQLGLIMPTTDKTILMP
jgi:cell division protein FtsL